MEASNFKSYERRFNPHTPCAGKRILVYRAGGIGDAFIATGLVRAVKESWPDSEVFVSTPTASHVVFHGLPVESFVEFPLHFDAMRNFFDSHLLLDETMEDNNEVDQSCCYDDLLAFAGFDEQDIRPEWTRPWVRVLPQDVSALEQVWPRWEEGSRYAVLHLTASNLRSRGTGLSARARRDLGSNRLSSQATGVREEIALAQSTAWPLNSPSTLNSREDGVSVMLAQRASARHGLPMELIVCVSRKPSSPTITPTRPSDTPGHGCRLVSHSSQRHHGSVDTNTTVPSASTRPS